MILSDRTTREAVAAGRMKIGQVGFQRVTTPADVPYGSGGSRSKYQRRRGPTPSRFWENFGTDRR